MILSLTHDWEYWGHGLFMIVISQIHSVTIYVSRIETSTCNIRKSLTQWRSQLDGSGHAASPMYMGGGGVRGNS